MGQRFGIPVAAGAARGQMLPTVGQPEHQVAVQFGGDRQTRQRPCRDRLVSLRLRLHEHLLEKAPAVVPLALHQQGVRP